jgi:lipopolysaccharide biosynthesis glycosyltransferase
MKKAVVTLSIDFDELGDISHPLLKKYANKIRADFIVIRDKIVNNIYFCKFKIRELFEKYDRILFIDSDILVRPDCPDLFEIVPEDCFGIYNECPDLDRTISAYNTINQWMKQTMAYYGYNFRWNISRSVEKRTPYYNTGVMVISKIHKDLFKLPNPIIQKGIFGKNISDHTEQSYLNCRILDTNTKVFDLTYKFNRLTKMETIKESYLDSYIIHYAGVKHDRYGKMKKDYENIILNIKEK